MKRGCVWDTSVAAAGCGFVAHHSPMALCGDSSSGPCGPGFAAASARAALRGRRSAREGVPGWLWHLLVASPRLSTGFPSPLLCAAAMKTRAPGTQLVAQTAWMLSLPNPKLRACKFAPILRGCWGRGALPAEVWGSAVEPVPAELGACPAGCDGDGAGCHHRRFGCFGGGSALQAGKGRPG